MLVVETIAKGRSIRGIVRGLGIPGNTVRRVVRGGATQHRIRTGHGSRGRSPGVKSGSLRFSWAERRAAATREVAAAEDPGAAVRFGPRRGPVPVPAMGGQAGRRGFRGLRPPGVEFGPGEAYRFD